MNGKQALRAAVTVAFLVACSKSADGSSILSPSTRSPSIPRAEAAQRYAALAAPFDAAVANFDTGSGRLPVSASVDDFAALARPFADTVAALDAGLRMVVWPPEALRHLRSEITSDEALRSYLIGTLDVTLILSVWRHQIVVAERKATKAMRAVSVDLGLVVASGR